MGASDRRVYQLYKAKYFVMHLIRPKMADASGRGGAAARPCMDLRCTGNDIRPWWWWVVGGAIIEG